MEDYKHEFYTDDHSGKGMPVTELLEADGHFILQQFGAKIDTVSYQPEVVLDHLFTNGGPVEANILDEEFDIAEVIERLALPCSERIFLILCNGPDYKYAVELRSQDIAHLLDYLWYPPADDAIVIDGGLKWALSLAHYGALKHHRAIGEH